MGLPKGSGSEGAERAPRSHDPLVGTVINGKFHVERAIARGGMGRIYLGRQAPLDRPVALKVVKADSVNEEESQFLKRFLLEASILAKLQHPNVVTLFDYGRVEGSSAEMYFIAMEYLDGETLTERLRARGTLGCVEALSLFRQIARGLREAHSRDVVHRDLKPSNIVIVPEADGGELVKLVDFGIGKVERSGEDLTREGVLVGTPKYMAPEQFDGASSAASDVYALGVILYQCLAGTLPFPGNTLPELMIAKLQRDVPPLSELNPACDAPARLEDLIMWMLARRPEDRPTLDEVFEQLSACEEEVFGASGARRTLSSGARPLGSTTGSRPHSIGALKVPYTIVAPVLPGDVTPRLTNSSVPPRMAASSASVPLPSGPTPLPTSGAVPLVTGFTPRPMATSARPPLPPRSNVPIAVAVAVLFAFACVGAVALWTKTRARGDEPPASPASVTAPVATTAPAPTATDFVLHIRSTPAGAAVTEDNAVLGVTPLDVKIDAARAARTPRVFILKKDGFADKVITQGLSDGDTAQEVTLTPDPPRPTKSPSRPAGKPPAGKPREPADDIRHKR